MERPGFLGQYRNVQWCGFETYTLPANVSLDEFDSMVESMVARNPALPYAALAAGAALRLMGFRYEPQVVKSYWTAEEEVTHGDGSTSTYKWKVYPNPALKSGHTRMPYDM